MNCLLSVKHCLQQNCLNEFKLRVEDSYGYLMILAWSEISSIFLFHFEVDVGARKTPAILAGLLHLDEIQISGTYVFEAYRYL